MRRPTRRARATAACSLSTALLLALAPNGAPSAAALPAGPAQGPSAALAGTTDPDPRVVPDGARGGIAPRTPALRSGVAARPPAGVGAAGLPAALSPTLTEVPQGTECPTGTARLRTHLTESFEKGTLPEPETTRGWSVVRGQARTGAWSARSVISASDKSTQPSGNPAYWAMAMPLVKVPGGRTMLRFAIKGSYPAETAYIAVNDAAGWATPTTSWGAVTLDVSSALTSTDGGWVDVRFANYPKDPATNSTIDIDDVEVYTCTGQSKTRGDFDGDGLADVLTVDGPGTLKIWSARGDLRVQPGRHVGHGWGSMTWLGSPGDLNRDGRADLMARSSDGTLYAYWGDGGGGFSSGSAVIGTGWQGMTSIVPMGDINGDGLVDVLACDGRTGQLRRYWFTSPTSPMTGGTVVGTGFNGFTTLLTLGDHDGDGRSDLVGILPNGDMKVYTTLADGRLFGWGTRIGNGWSFTSVSSPGSFNRDAHPDVLARDASGRLFTYPTLGRGTWGARVLTGTSFDQFRLIL